VPASRSRTERWRDCLEQIHARNGSIEITVCPGAAADESGSSPSAHAQGPSEGTTSLVWRVRLVALRDAELVVEAPTAMGHAVPILEGVRLIGIMAIGQNRWMFHTTVLARDSQGARGTLRLAMPARMERCQRRNFYRISTASISLPHAECWPLLSPSSVALAEAANRAQIEEARRAPRLGAVATTGSGAMLPEVGPCFRARLLNIGGGGAGLLIDRDCAGAVDRARLFWLRVDLRPHIPLPIGVTARLAHTHIDSALNLYAGLAFDFSFNPAHREFVIQEICRYVAGLQSARATAA